MAENTSLIKKRKDRPRNNLNSFDTSQIEAELLAIEAETLGLDPSSRKVVEESNNSNIDTPTETIRPTADVDKQSYFKPREQNTVQFSPENSEVLHRLSRNGRESGPKVEEEVKETIQPKPKKEWVSPKPQVKVQPKQKEVKSRPTFVAPKNVGRNIDGVVSRSAPKRHSRLDAKISPALKDEEARPVNLTSVALRGLKQANEFNSYALREHKASLHNQIENRSLFENNLHGDIQMVDDATRQRQGVKRYTKFKRRPKMLGGVYQHDLDTVGVKKAFRFRSVRLLMPVLALFFIGSYVMYVNMPNIRLKLAENEAGISINQPSYNPDGFKLSGVTDTETGRVAMSFKNGDSNYSVSQAASDWDSKALLENKVLKESTEYSSYTDRGLTIYVYNGKAVWVNQGKVNEIDSANSNLGAEEMVRIAGSM